MFHGEFQQVIAPYQHILQAEGAEPLRAVANLLQTAAALRTSPPGQRAALVADMVRTFGIDVEMLDQALAARLNGRQAPVNPLDSVMQALDQKLKPVMDFMGNVQTTRQTAEQQARSEAERVWNEFVENPENEFAQDLREDMADLMQVAASRVLLHWRIRRFLDSSSSVGKHPVPLSRPQRPVER